MIVTENLYTVAVACPGWLIEHVALADGGNRWHASSPLLTVASNGESLAGRSAAEIVASVFEVETQLFAQVVAETGHVLDSEAGLDFADVHLYL